MPLGLALADPRRSALASAFLLLGFIGTGSSCLALAVFAERRRLKTPQFPSKGLYYIGGFTEGFETIACFILMCLFPARYAAFAFLFAALCFVTAAMRWWWGYRILS